ncbi:SDR family oxidoreductase [bacterium]|nr:SDR family oxidoreductase [bacterium]
MNILLTGVSRGLGFVTAELLLDAGHTVYGISRKETEQLVGLIEHYPDQMRWLSYDLSDDVLVRDKIMKEWIGLTTPIHGFVNNAAYAYDDIASNANSDRLLEMHRINVITPIIMTKYILRNMLLNRVAGSMVHISSISVHTGYKGLSMYASTKGALEAYSKNIAREWGELGIRSNCIVAGFMNTEMTSSLSDGQKDRIYRRTSLKSAVDEQSVAETIWFLLSEKSKSITGQNIFVDSGTI